MNHRFFRTLTKPVISVLIMASFCGATAFAGTGSSIESTGKIVSDSDNDGVNDVVYDADDLTALESGINTLSSNVADLSAKYSDLETKTAAGKKAVIDALNNAGLTKLTDDAPFIGTGSIVEGIAALGTPPEGTTIASEGNISKNFAAIVPGKGWITGNGTDNDAAYQKGYKQGQAEATSNLQVNVTAVKTIYNWTISGNFGAFHGPNGGEGYTPGSVTIYLPSYGIDSNDIVIATGTNFYTQQSNYGDLSNQYGNIPAATYSYSRNGDYFTINGYPYVQDKVWFYGTEWEGWRCIASNVSGSVIAIVVQ